MTASVPAHDGGQSEDGDRLASFSETYRSAYPAVLAFLRRRVEPADAEELASEVFLAAWQAWGTVPAKDVRPWLFGIARNLAANSLRTGARHRQLDLRAADPARPEPDLAGQAAFSLDLRGAWARLGDADREVLALVAWDGLTGREAAKVLGCTRAAFSVRLTRARRRLHRLMDAPDPSGTRTRGESRPVAVIHEGSAS